MYKPSKFYRKQGPDVVNFVHTKAFNLKWAEDTNTPTAKYRLTTQGFGRTERKLKTALVKTTK